MKRIAIVGPSECGKTSVAISLSRTYWAKHHIASLVLDPWKNEHNWGPQAWVCSDEETFWASIWKRTGDLVIIDEGSSTIARDKDLIPLFTKIRHNKHTLCVIAHDATDLVPTMRRNLNELYLFPQGEAAIKLWRNDLPLMRGISKAAIIEGQPCQMQPYEFLWCRNYKDAEVHKLKL